MTWTETLRAALNSIPSDVDGKAIRKVVSACLKDRQPVKPWTQHQQFFDAWCKAFYDKFKIGYPVMGGKDGAAVKKLLAFASEIRADRPTGFDEVEHLMRIAKAAWDHPETFACRQARTLGGFMSKFAEIRIELEEMRTGKGNKGTKMPAFKQLEILRASLAQHPCNPRSISYNPDSASLKADYSMLKRKIAELEADEGKRARA